MTSVESHDLSNMILEPSRIRSVRVSIKDFSSRMPDFLFLGFWGFGGLGSTFLDFSCSI